MSDDDPTDLFDTDNVVVCQFDKASVCSRTVESAILIILFRECSLSEIPRAFSLGYAV